MAFYGCEFIFDDISSREFGLMLYTFDNEGQDDTVAFTSPGNIVSDHIPGRTTNFLYGIDQEDPLEFKMVFGVPPARIDDRSHLDRPEISAVASWLAGHGKWKRLQIVQPDMLDYYYNVVVSELELITDGTYPWAFTCTVTCDSAYAHTMPSINSYTTSSGGATIRLKNRSTHNGFYRPTLTLSLSGGGSLSIVNQTDGNREFAFTNLPASVMSISVDNENQIIKDTKNDLNLYEYFNFNFLRLKRGENVLVLKGDFTVTIDCEFLVDIGG